MRKCRAYAGRLDDPQARELAQKLAAKHQQHYQRLLDRLGADL